MDNIGADAITDSPAWQFTAEQLDHAKKVIAGLAINRTNTWDEARDMARYLLEAYGLHPLNLGFGDLREAAKDV